MNLFGLSPGELLLIMMVAMVVLGPEKLPEVAASLGKWIREFRRATEELTAQFADNNPLYELQRAFTLGDDPPPAAPAEAVAPASMPEEPAASVVAPASLAAPVAQLPAPVHSDYFNFPQMYPSVSDLWVHGSLPDLPRRNGHTPFDGRPIAEEWTFGVPIVRPAPIAEPESSVEANAIAAPSDDAGAAGLPESELLVAELATVPEADAEVAALADEPEVPPTSADAAPVAVEGMPPARPVVEPGALSHNGVTPHPVEETLAVPVPAGAVDGREGERP